MRKFKKAIVSVLTVSVLMAFIQTLHPPKAEENAQMPLPNPMASAPEVVLSTSIVRMPWPGEVLVYKVRQGLMTVGEASLSVMKKTVLVSSRPCYHIISTARSSSFLDRFYKVRDRNDSWMDAVTLTSMGYSKKIREGKFFRDIWVKFDPETLTFTAQKTDKKKHSKRSSGKLPGPVQDILSSLYYLRAKPLEVGKDIIMDINSKKNWPLVIKVHRRQTVKTPAGKFDCFLVEPRLREEGIFVAKGKSVLVWLTADQKHIPVLMKAEILVGQISARLVSCHYE